MNALMGFALAFAVGSGPQANQSTAIEKVLTGVLGVTQVQGSCAEKATAHCKYKCRCKYFKRTKAHCLMTYHMRCPGRLCGPCLGRARAKAKKHCGRRGNVRICNCTFKRKR